MAPCAACAESSIPPAASRCNGARPEQKSLNKKARTQKIPRQGEGFNDQLGQGSAVFLALARLFSLNLSRAV
jgi:hypothetical protein